MTEKQHNYINSLMKERAYDYTTEIQAFRTGYDLTVKQASDLIAYLLNCDKLPAVNTDLKKIEYALLKVIKNKKTKKNHDKHKLVFEVIGRYLDKSTYYDLTAEEFRAIAHIVL